VLIGNQWKKASPGSNNAGTGGDVVEHGERITLALREAGADSDAFHESTTGGEITRADRRGRLREDGRTGVVGEGDGEKAGQSPGDDLQTAGEKLTESYEKVEEDDTEGAVERWGESINHVARAADSASRKALRRVEDAVYQKVMTQVAPYYFDNELISANVTEVGRGENGETFEFEVNVNDDDLKSEVSEILAEYESEIDRWHVETEKRTEDVAAAEGVEPPEEEGGPESTMT
jgi:hypothetical protein